MLKAKAWGAISQDAWHCSSFRLVRAAKRKRTTLKPHFLRLKTHSYWEGVFWSGLALLSDPEPCTVSASYVPYLTGPPGAQPRRAVVFKEFGAAGLQAFSAQLWVPEVLGAGQKCGEGQRAGGCRYCCVPTTTILQFTILSSHIIT